MRKIRLKEVIKESLYQRGQFVTFPWSSKMKMLEQYDIGMVVNLWARPDPELHTKSGLVYIHWPMSGTEPPLLADSMIELINDYLCSGTKVLVHCEAGVNRSIWLVTRLLARNKSLSGCTSLEQVKASVNKTKLRPGLLKDLTENDC